MTRQEAPTVVRSAAHRARAAARRRPAAVAAALAALLLAAAAARLFGSLPPGTWPHLRDSVKFEYVGWYLSRGNRLYLDAWAVKPPLPFEVTAVLAAAAGGSVVRYHALAVLANAAAAVVAAAAGAGIVRVLTDDALGAVVGGVGAFALPFYPFRALIGFKAKYLIVAATLGCLYCAYRERPAAAGVAGAAAVGLWQLAAAVPLVALGRCWQTGGRPAAARVVAAGLATGGLVLLPVVAWGAVPAMVTEVVLTPLLVAEDHALADRAWRVAAALGPAAPVALLGLAGVVGGLAPGRVRREWPLAFLAGWFGLALLALDFDNTPDLFPWLAVVSVGAGVAVGRVRASAPGRSSAPAVAAGSAAGGAASRV
ncbi:MAG: DolP-mannose mannosyltransferase, partial [Haloferacaceae archaeon]